MTEKEKQRELVRRKYSGHCSYCGEVLKANWHVDHVVPVIRRGGQMCRPEADVLENKMPACASCNINKHQMSVEQFRQFIAQFPETLSRKVTYRIAKRYGLVTETGKAVQFYFELTLPPAGAKDE